MTTRETIDPFIELGATTRTRMGRSLYDDFLPALRGSQALRTYREMGDNDDTIGGVLFAVEMLLRGLEWSVEPASDQPADGQVAEEIDAELERVEFRDHVALATSQVQYGFAFFEQVFERRSDGKVGWARFGYRPQFSLTRWILADNGDPLGFVQNLDAGEVIIPVEKGLLYRTRTDSPEGRSWLRPAYRAWYYRKRATEIAMVGLKRDLTGFPVARIPGEQFAARDSTFEWFTDMIRRIGVDAQQGAVLPSDLDPETGGKLYDLETITSSGAAKIDPIGMIRMFSADIAGSMLAGFLGLGRDAVGSRALAEPMQELFRTAIEGLADEIADVVTGAFPLLLSLQGKSVDPPRLVHSPVKDIDLAAMGTFLRDSAQAGIVWDGDDRVADRVRGMAGFPPAEDVVE